MYVCAQEAGNWLCIIDKFADYFIGTKIGNDLKVEKELSAYDEDAKLTIDYLVGLETCNGRIGATGTLPFPLLPNSE